MINFLKFSIMLIIVLPKHSLEVPEALLKDSKKSFDYIEKMSEGDNCMKSIFLGLKTRCNKIEEDLKSRIALKMANCQFKKSGKNYTECLAGEHFQECTKRISGDEWVSYQAFYTHVDNMCFYFKSEIWQENSEKLIEELTYKTAESSQLIQQNLEKTKIIYQLQENIDEQMSQSLINNLETSRRIQESFDYLEKMNGNIGSSFQKIKNSIEEQEHFIGQFFFKLNEQIKDFKLVQNWLLGEFFDLKAVLYHFSAICGSLLITSLPVFYSARSSVLLGLFFNMEANIILFMMERFLRSSIHAEKYLCAIITSESSDCMIKKLEYINFMRMVFLITVMTILWKSFNNFKDYGHLTFQGVNIINKKLDGLSKLKEKLEKLSTPYIQNKLRSSLKIFMNNIENKALFKEPAPPEQDSECSEAEEEAMLDSEMIDSSNFVI